MASAGVVSSRRAGEEQTRAPIGLGIRLLLRYDGPAPSAPPCRRFLVGAVTR